MIQLTGRTGLLRAVVAFALALACGSNNSENLNQLPSFVKGAIVHQTYDGTSNDLLTGGLGKTGLAAAATALPAFADPAHPTAAELRTRAIYNNYRALVDYTAAGGFGVLYGPNIDTSGNDTLGEGKIAGDEYLAYDDDGTGQVNVTMMVQVPSTFDPANPCIVTGTSSGSRGVYGAIATSGEWGLKHRCAVAYTDKGSGLGVHDLTNNTVNLITGERADAATAGSSSNFTAPLTGSALASFNASDPNRFAFKHAHSKQNPEKDWGKFTLDAVQFAFYVLNQQFGQTSSNGKDKLKTINPSNAIVIASSVSNGGGAALQAAELDSSNLIDGVVAGEPQIQVAPDARRSILRNGAAVAANGKPLYDYATLANLYQPCASQATSAASSPGLSFVDATRAKARCATLRALGYLTKDAVADQADEALAKLHEAGFEKETDLLHASQWAFATPAIAVTYAYSYGRFGVEQRTCGYTFAATDANGAPIAPTANNLAQIFASGNGIPPTGTINVVADTAKNGPILDALAQSQSSGVADYNADGADCLRKLYTGSDANAQAVKTGVGEVQRTANLHGKPAILVQGRSDQNVPVNHASRAWMAQNRLAEGAGSKARYLEVTNAQHFDTFIPAITGYQTAFIPLHRYFIQAMDMMYASLKSGAALPDSQVVRTTPRSSATAQISTTNVPAVPLTASAADKITFQGDALSIPD